MGQGRRVAEQRPVVVLTRDSMVDRLARVTVAPVTTTVRGIAPEVALGTEDGVKRRARSTSTTSSWCRSRASAATWLN